MEKRNFYILVSGIIIGMSIFWLSLYAIVILDIDPLHRIKAIFGDEDTKILTIKGNVNREIELSVADIKSDKYHQVIDRTFHFLNAIGNEFDEIYSGASLWSILEEEDILNEEASSFIFIGGDGYWAESYLPLALAENYTEQIIIAYHKNGEPIYFDGPLRSIVDHELIPDKANTHYAIKYLKTIIIQ
ncbi:MAG: molybdopterin-dependent oxidoreductase [Candidatus Hermodarchaeota archaeon]